MLSMNQARRLLLVFSVALLVGHPKTFGQTPGAVERIEYLEAEIRLLKLSLAEQSRRLEGFEKKLESLTAALGSLDSKQTSITAAPAPRTESRSTTGWKIRGNWDKIQIGMSERQVKAILGSPTSLKVLVGSLKTLFYRGEVPGSGFVSGNLGLSGDRVYIVNRPVF